MPPDHTEQQSPADEQRSKKLSLQQTRPPTEVPGYDVQRLIGTGAYGEVWVGVDRNTGRQVAIKFYAHHRGVDWQLLSREVEKLVFLSADRYVVQLLVVGWDAQPPYYIMEYVENGSLEDLLREGALTVPQAVEMFREIAVGLAHAHGKGVLHCDLKPANILLDQDHRPRLADFGQSRLTTEQRPALGTLFYMAPEQASLEAVPDVQWDVYGLGAILYCMLVGEPPHRHEGSLSQLETAQDLPERLERYRRLITEAPPIADHARVRGVDRALSEIIARCLAAEPKRRFANVQEVLDALMVREETRRRRPLLLLGILAPLLFLAIMALFGWRGYKDSLSYAESIARKQAVERNRKTAEVTAQAVLIELNDDFEIVRREANRAQLHGKLAVQEGDQLRERLAQRNLSKEERERLIIEYTHEPARVDFNHYVEDRLQTYLAVLESNPEAPKFASLLVLDKHGTMVAAAYDSEDLQSQSVARNFTFRSYFHGGPADLPRSTKPDELQPLDHTQLSAVFQSSTSKNWKVAISTPIPPADGMHEAGYVMVFTINLGDFQFMRSEEGGNIFPVLVDGRTGENTGVILQHPAFNKILDREGRLPTRFKDLRVSLDASGNLPDGLYQDPVGSDPLGAEYRGEWLASAARVRRLRISRPQDDPTVRQERDTGLIIVMQERYNLVTEPVRELGQRLLWEGTRALAVLILVSVILWFVILRWLRATPAEVRRKIMHATGDSSDSKSVHVMTTMAATKKQ